MRSARRTRRPPAPWRRPGPAAQSPAGHRRAGGGPGRPDDPDALGGQDGLPARLVPALERLREVFAVHVEVTEAPGGLYQEILENAPRLANRVTRFRREHAEITEGIRRGLAECAAADTPAAVQALRDHSVRLFADLVRHRKRGLDLVYEAYHVDIGGES